MLLENPLFLNLLWNELNMSLVLPEENRSKFILWATSGLDGEFEFESSLSAKFWIKEESGKFIFRTDNENGHYQVILIMAQQKFDRVMQEWIEMKSKDKFDLLSQYLLSNQLRLLKITNPNQEKKILRNKIEAIIGKNSIISMEQILDTHPSWVRYHIRTAFSLNSNQHMWLRMAGVGTRSGVYHQFDSNYEIWDDIR